MSSITSPFDQASGLRELFASMDGGSPVEAPSGPHPAVHGLVCPSRPALSLPLAQACSRLLRQRGQRHAWIDEIDFDAREDWPLPCSVRFDLGQSLAGHVPLASSLQSLADPMSWYALARRLGQSTGSAEPSLAERLSLSGLDFSHVLVSADPRMEQRSWSLYGARVRPVVLCETDAASVQATVAWMNAQARANSGLDMSACGMVLLDPGYAGGAATAANARDLVEDAWLALHGHPLAWVDQADVAAPDESLISFGARCHVMAQSLLDRMGIR